jgi:hypothetical protein
LCFLFLNFKNMSLIKCSECGKEVSDKAATCPNCGNPMNGVNKTLVQIDSAPSKRRKFRIWFLIFAPMFFIGLILAMIWGSSAIMGGESRMLGFWILFAIVGFVGMVITAIRSWLAAP